MTSNIVFVLGRTPDLAFAELIHTYPDRAIRRIHPHAAVIQTHIDPQAAIDQLGGTVTIGKILGEIPQINPSLLATYIHENTLRSVTFCISHLGSEPFSESLLQGVKHALRDRGVSSRYIVNKKHEPLSAVIVRGQDVEEYLVIPVKEGNILAKTLVVQNIPRWVKRDAHRPYIDPRRGMLPLKVARMLLNIVSKQKDLTRRPLLLDPFCGMGTILSEALLLGWEVIGSDISREVVDKAQGNLSWLTREYPHISSRYTLLQSDAVHVSRALGERLVDAIVTEPFMGSPSFALEKHVHVEDVRNVIKGLEKLYIGCLKDWKHILKPGGVLLIALPTFRLKGRELFVKKVIDSCESLGYSVIDGPWTYSRPQALVQRTLYLFQKN
jgi:tRNA G10  N-methylase Trm11